MLKNPADYEKGTLSEKYTAIFAKFLPASLLGVSGGKCQTDLVDESGMISTQMGKAQYIRKWSQCLGRLPRYHTVTVTVILCYKNSQL
jgi:hypothetical protein